jgi:hypothetical protein
VTAAVGAFSLAGVAKETREIAVIGHRAGLDVEQAPASRRVSASAKASLSDLPPPAKTSRASSGE